MDGLCCEVDGMDAQDDWLLHAGVVLCLRNLWNVVRETENGRWGSKVEGRDGKGREGKKGR